MTRAALLSAVLSLAPRVDAATLIHAGRVIDVVDREVDREITIVVEDGRITALRPGYSKPAAGDELIDLRSHSVLPGLMDMHTHLSMEFSKNVYLERFQLDATDVAYRSVPNAERTLMAGFTTVRDLGDRFNATIALRKAIAAGHVVGPRIFTAAKSIATTGGHADPTNGMAAYLLDAPPGPKEGVADGPWQAVRAVRQRYKDGADLIKITATGGVLSVAKSGHNPQFTEEELTAIVTTARDYGMHVAAHAHGAEGMKRAIRAGVRSIEHGTFMDDEVIALMKEHGTYYVPTIMAGEWVAEKAELDDFFPALVRPKAKAIGPLILGTFGRAWKAGVKIAFGTDSGVSAHGDNAREFELMVSAGMPAMDAIRAATLTSAELLEIDAELGSITVGKIADLIAVEGDPLGDVGTLRSVAFVMKQGTIYKRPTER